jgi:hypothetical protein
MSFGVCSVGRQKLHTTRLLATRTAGQNPADYLLSLSFLFFGGKWPSSPACPANQDSVIELMPVSSASSIRVVTNGYALA